MRTIVTLQAFCLCGSGAFFRDGTAVGLKFGLNTGNLLANSLTAIYILLESNCSCSQAQLVPHADAYKKIDIKIVMQPLHGYLLSLGTSDRQ